MDLNNYFENTKGRGILATADADGKVDAAVFARPHVAISFIKLYCSLSATGCLTPLQCCSWPLQRLQGWDEGALETQAEFRWSRTHLMVIMGSDPDGREQ